ncbi:Putative uncharacterized transposon-derived protein F52C9.6 [Eumeta japonica]|uniref:Uncharacterized transposon-derived protein F52C9.6 n=1 Tax=Eumeta variegata TaxID=151549 RepID=A0A4C1TT32_EUMVA|nr:Putative uncharacterized transposon-derived protein F52C9.6 [Eumeta japonica]
MDIENRTAIGIRIDNDVGQYKNNMIIYTFGHIYTAPSGPKLSNEESTNKKPTRAFTADISMRDQLRWRRCATCTRIVNGVVEISGEEFQIAKGVRQGDPLSPKLFSAILESVFRDLEWEKDGINIDGKKLNHLRFADSLVLITDNATTLQHMLQQLTEASRKVGQIIAFKDKTNIEIERRVANAWNRYWSLKEILKSEHFPITAKRKVFNSCVLPCLAYGCQTWALSQKHFLKLRTCQRGMERSMIGVTKRDRIRSEDIRSITKVEDIIKKIRQLKWRWTEHMTRDSRIKWTKILTEWQPRDGTRKRGRRKRGRQAKKWMDDIRKIGGATWSRKARDREEWKRLEEAYVSQDTLINLG